MRILTTMIGVSLVSGCGMPSAVNVVLARAASGHADPDDNLLQVVVQLTNTTSSPLAISPAQFRVKTRAGLLVPASAAPRLRWVSAGTAPAPFVELAPGAVLPALGLAFPVLGADAVSVEYTAATLSASAPLTVEPCQSCDGSCTYLDIETERCCDGPEPIGGSCVNHAAVCPEGRVACGTTSRRCVNLASDSQHCGACGNAVPMGGSCQAGSAACFGADTRCSRPSGGEYCADLGRSPTDCGTCGSSCWMLGIQPLNSLGDTCIGSDCELCVARRCDGWLNNWDQVSCSQFCQAKGLTCADSGGFSCAESEYWPGRGSCGGTSGADYDYSNVPGGGGKGTWWKGISCSAVPPQNDDHFRCHCVK